MVKGPPRAKFSWFSLTELHRKVTFAEGAREKLGRVSQGPQGDTATERRIAKLDEQLKQLMKEMGDAINESLSKPERIGEVIGNIKHAGYDVFQHQKDVVAGVLEVIGNIKHAGYDVFLVLEAKIGFNRREESIKKEPLKSVTNPSGRVRFTTQDAKFLKALKISVDEERH